jgi:hypothetical protein
VDFDFNFIGLDFLTGTSGGTSFLVLAIYLDFEGDRCDALFAYYFAGNATVSLVFYKFNLKFIYLLTKI